jgi:hypothetical protein
MPGQMVPILAAIRHDDPPTVAKDKASRIANFIDRWYVLRVIDDLPVQHRDLDELTEGLLGPLRACRTSEQVTAVLDQKVLSEDTPFKAFGTFGKRGNNSHQIRYLLGRITAYVAESLDKPNEIQRYLNAERSWQIEHIFADHAEPHPEITDPLVFRALRNPSGGSGAAAAPGQQQHQRPAIRRKDQDLQQAERPCRHIEPEPSRKQPDAKGLHKKDRYRVPVPAVFPEQQP